jgi:hypothetical protein
MLWEGRYKATVIETEQYLLTCMRYIELNPVRAQWRPVVEAAIENLRLIDKLINESDPLVLRKAAVIAGLSS